MNIRKQKARQFKYDDDGRPYCLWRKTTRVYANEFYRESVRFIDVDRKYWHGMDCTRDLVIHICDDNDSYILGKMTE
jgi:hypothetical protein